MMVGKLIVLAFVFTIFNVDAGVRPLATRAVVSLNNSSDISIENTSNHDYMVQAWLEDLNGNHENLGAFIHPQLFKMGPSESGFVKVISIANKLPLDRESVYILSLQEIPPKSEDVTNKNILRIAVKTKIKVFFRPDDLTRNGFVKAYNNDIKWFLNNEGDLVAENTSPYYFSFGVLKLQSGEDVVLLNNRNMLAPFSLQKYIIPKMDSNIKEWKLIYSAINEYGGKEELKYKVFD